MARCGSSGAIDQSNQGGNVSSSSETYKKAVKADREITGTMFCTHCQLRRSQEGGQWKLVNAGKNRRWKCAECVARAKARAEGRVE